MNIVSFRTDLHTPMDSCSGMLQVGLCPRMQYCKERCKGWGRVERWGRPKEGAGECSRWSRVLSCLRSSLW